MVMWPSFATFYDSFQATFAIPHSLHHPAAATYLPSEKERKGRKEKEGKERGIGGNRKRGRNPGTSFLSYTTTPNPCCPPRMHLLWALWHLLNVPMYFSHSLRHPSQTSPNPRKTLCAPLCTLCGLCHFLACLSWPLQHLMHTPPTPMHPSRPTPPPMHPLSHPCGTVSPFLFTCCDPQNSSLCSPPWLVWHLSQKENFWCSLQFSMRKLNQEAGSQSEVAPTPMAF